MKTKQANAFHLHACTVPLTLAVVLLAAPATSRGDTLYVSTSGNTIEKFDLASGTDLGVFAKLAGLNAPMGLAFDGAGNLYAANYQGNSIEKFTPGGVGSVFADFTSGLNTPMGLAFDSAGNLYAANYLGSTIEKFTPGGVGSVFASTGVRVPSGIAFDSTGNLYVANGNNTIEKFTPGGVGSVFASTGLNDPTGLAFDSAGNLYAANWGNNTIEKFTPGGVGSVFASTDLTHPGGLVLDSAGKAGVTTDCLGTLGDIISQRRRQAMNRRLAVFQNQTGGRVFVRLAQ